MPKYGFLGPFSLLAWKIYCKLHSRYKQHKKSVYKMTLKNKTTKKNFFWQWSSHNQSNWTASTGPANMQGLLKQWLPLVMQGITFTWALQYVNTLLISVHGGKLSLNSKAACDYINWANLSILHTIHGMQACQHVDNINTFVAKAI